MENRHTGFGCKELKEVLLFQTTSAALWLSQKMSWDGPALVRDELTLDQGFAVEGRFRDGKEKLLITTVDLALEIGKVKNSFVYVRHKY